MIVRTGLNHARLYGIASDPLIPDAAAAIRAAMTGSDEAPREWPGSAAEALSALTPGAAIAVPENLFRKISDEEREGWEAGFGGTG